MTKEERKRAEENIFAVQMMNNTILGRSERGPKRMRSLGGCYLVPYIRRTAPGWRGIRDGRLSLLCFSDLSSLQPAAAKKGFTSSSFSSFLGFNNSLSFPSPSCPLKAHSFLQFRSDYPHPPPPSHTHALPLQPSQCLWAKPSLLLP